MTKKTMKAPEIESVEITLGSQRVGYLTHYRGGKNIFAFAEEYVEMGSHRPTLSLSYSRLDNHMQTQKSLSKVYSSMHGLPIFFSNLLPEGALRELILMQRKIHDNDEYSLLLALAGDLPGNLHINQIEPIAGEQLTQDNKINITPTSKVDQKIRFSLPGVQIKFSMRKGVHRFTLSKPELWGDYIIKTPSVTYPYLAENEYSMMRLAEAAGVSIPEIQLVPLSELEGLPRLNLPNEKYAYAIKRFDRENNERIHIEDFAQVFSVRSHEKYTATNYDSMAKLMLGQFHNSAQQINQFVKRLVVNILLGNTDAHLKNWSIRFSDTRRPELAPAYDIVSSLEYIDDREAALNVARVKDFYKIDMTVLQRFAKRVGFPENWVTHSVEETLDLVNTNWRTLILDLPIHDATKLALREHHKRLLSPFALPKDWWK